LVPPSATYETADSGDGPPPSTAHPEINDAASEQRSDSDSGDAAGTAFDDTDVTDSEVADEDAAQTHASDQAIAREDARNARETERRDAQARPPYPQPGGFNPGALRTPPFPNDAADDSIHIRFHHPE
jgi:hypothetical protein